MTPYRPARDASRRLPPRDPEAPPAAGSPRARAAARIGVGLLAVLFVAWAGAFIYRTSFIAIDGERYFCLFDDSMISMRYAWNLAHGNGLVWNPGERVEGITNLLMTLVMAVPTGLLGKSGAVLAVQLLGVAVLLGVAFLTLEIGEALLAGTELAGRGALSVLFFVCGLAYYPLAFWTLMGMETGLLALLLLAAVRTAFRVDGDPAPSPLLALTLGLAFVTRPDAAIPIALVMLHRLWGVRRRPGWFRGRAVESAIIGGFVVAVSAFRWLYYGSVTPNTYTLKVEGFTVAERLANGLAFNEKLLESLLVPLVVALLALAVRRHRHALLIVGLLLASMAYELWVGGDSWPYWRINAPFVPPLLALSVAGLALAARRLTARLAGGRAARPLAAARAVVVAAALLGLLRLANADFLGELTLREPAYWVEANRENVDVALALNEVLEPGATIGVVWGGTIPYYAGFRAIDFLGKSDPHIAALPPDLSPPPRRRREPPWRLYNPGHNKFDLYYSIGKLKPTYVQKPYRRLLGRGGRSLLRAHYLSYRYKGVRLLLRRDSEHVDWERLRAGL